MGVTNPEGIKKYFVAAFPRYESERTLILIRSLLFLVPAVKRTWPCFGQWAYPDTKWNASVCERLLPTDEDERFYSS